MSAKPDDIKAQYGRVKGAEWFPHLHKRDIMVLGQGGIGSWVTLLLGRIGANLYTFDMDRYESHNMTGQLVRQEDVGKLKTEALQQIVAQFSPDCQISIFGRYEEDSMSNDIVICGFDNMAARKLAFTKWRHHVENDAADKSKCFFQDGRLNSEQLQIFNIPGDKPERMDEYEKDYLFEDSEVAEVECSFKQTSHCAAMIGGHMVAFITNWVTNSEATPYRQLPFFYQYVVPLNYTE